MQIFQNQPSLQLPDPWFDRTHSGALLPMLPRMSGVPYSLDRKQQMLLHEHDRKGHAEQISHMLLVIHVHWMSRSQHR
ncbi:hypothetical protein IAQ61_002835 [Plenodomus lingam]|uniref:uncharacterized protein n=1 Tax=Leptosphaeria maculans TaxID=5022 RepID=UPI0033208824|nr:hypothetical protein IAQ61_002835 [Plenodomus lingam]